MNKHISEMNNSNSFKQPEALRLAELMDYLSNDSYDWWQEFDKCAAELRHLHDKTVLADQVIEQRHSMISDLYSLNQELVNELKKLVAEAESNIRSEFEGTKELRKNLSSLDSARAAIAKATGGAV